MNNRMYDPIVARMLAVDNFVQSPFSTQSYNRYGYCLNNPLKYKDSNGEWIHIVIGAAVGGIINLGIKAYQGKINDWGDGFAAFGIGAAAGAIGAATGGAALSVTGLTATTFAGGAVAGAAGAAVASPILGVGNFTFFQDPYGAKQWGRDVVIGAALGGAIGYVSGKFVKPQGIPIPEGESTSYENSYGRAEVGKPQVTKFADNPTIEIDYDKVIDKLSQHAFSNARFDGILGGDKSLITSEAVKIIDEIKPLFIEGSNQWTAQIGGEVVTMRCFVQNGVVVNANMFPGETSRIIGNLIIIR